MRQPLGRSYLSLGLLLAQCGLVGCAVGPNYKRPTIDVPATYRGTTDGSAPSENSQLKEAKPEQSAVESAKPSFADEKWWEVFEDRQLQGLIRAALQNNYDVRIAAARVLEARAQLGITRADQFPSLSAGGNIASQQNPKIGPIPAYEVTQGEVAASAVHT